MEKPVAGQNELEALYSATRNVNLPAVQHEKLRGLAQVILARLQQIEWEGPGGIKECVAVEATEEADGTEPEAKAARVAKTQGETT